MRELQCVAVASLRRGAAASPTQIAPEHLELVGRRGGGACRSRDAAPAACSWARAPARRSATTSPGSNHVLPTGGAARFQSALVAGHVPAPYGSRILARRGARPVSLPQAPPWPAPRASPCTPSPWSAEREPHRPHPPRHTARPTSRCRSGSTAAAPASARTGVGFFDHLLDALARHGGLDLDVGVKGDLETGPAPHRRGHRHRARPGARRGARRPGRHRAASARGRADGRGARLAARSTSPAGRSLRLRGRLPGRARRATSTPTWPRSSSARWPAPPS